MPAKSSRRSSRRSTTQASASSLRASSSNGARPATRASTATRRPAPAADRRRARSSLFRSPPSPDRTQPIPRLPHHRRAAPRRRPGRSGRAAPGAVHVDDQRGVQAPTERRRQRQLIAGLYLQRVAERSWRALAPAPATPAWLRRNWLAAASSAPTSAASRRAVLGAASTWRSAVRACSATRVGLLARLACALQPEPSTARLARRPAPARRAAPRSRARAPLALAVDLGQRRLERLHAILAHLPFAIPGRRPAGERLALAARRRLRLERAQLDLDPLGARGERGGRCCGLLAAQLQALARRAGLVGTRLESASWRSVRSASAVSARAAALHDLRAGATRSARAPR